MPVSRKRRTRTRRPTADQQRRRSNRQMIDLVLDACPSCADGRTVSVTFLTTAEQAPSPKGTRSYTSAFLGDLSGSTDRP